MLSRNNEQISGIFISEIGGICHEREGFVEPYP